VIDRGNPPLFEAMGLGWVLGHCNGLKTASHGGMGFGWAAFLILLPEKKRAAVILCNEESYARSRIARAVIDTMLDQAPQAGTVSWMVPVSQALHKGGIQAANAWVAKFKESGAQDYSVDEDDLVNLMYQLRSVRKLNLAIAVLGLNLQVFPRNLDSYLGLADLYLKKGERAQAEDCLLKALAIQPDHIPAVELIDRVRGCMSKSPR
jgi:tetratricopeptide (TPR) repeat protein